jgi:hypothetical protein
VTSVAEMTSNPEIASVHEKTFVTERICTPEMASVPETISFPDSACIPETTSVLEMSPVPKMTSTPEVSSNPQKTPIPDIGSGPEKIFDFELSSAKIDTISGSSKLSISASKDGKRGKYEASFDQKNAVRDRNDVEVDRLENVKGFEDEEGVKTADEVDNDIKAVTESSKDNLGKRENSDVNRNEAFNQESAAELEKRPAQ